MKFSKDEQIARIRELRDDYGHAFVSPEGVDYFCQPFGFKGLTYLAKDSSDHPKGLMLQNNAREAEGQDADALALEIAHHLGLKPPTWQMGRGVRLRSFCNAIIDHLGGTR
jgi:hypothetical protein